MSSDDYPYIYTVFQPTQENFKGIKGMINNSIKNSKLTSVSTGRYTYTGEGGCHDDYAKVHNDCNNDNNCTYIGHQSNGCWHKLRKDPNGNSVPSTYTRGFYGLKTKMAQEAEYLAAQEAAKQAREEAAAAAAAVAAAEAAAEAKKKAEEEAKKEAKKEAEKEKLARERRRIAYEEKLKTWINSEEKQWESSQVEIEDKWNAKQRQMHNSWTKEEKERRKRENEKWNRTEKERKDKKIAEYNEMIDEKRVEFEANESSYKNALDEISAETDAKRAEWNTFKSAFCPSQGTFNLNDLKNSFGPNYPDINRYATIKSETKSTYDLLKRSEICTTIDNSELIEKYNNKVTNEQDILKDEHGELLRFFEKNIYNLSQRQIEEKENAKQGNNSMDYSTGDNINKRKSFYQGVQSYERNWYIRLIEIIYISVWVLMSISLLLKPEISMINKFLYIILFLILPYFVFNFIIYYIDSIIHYFNKNFNVYDNIYNHVK